VSLQFQRRFAVADACNVDNRLLPEIDHSDAPRCPSRCAQAVMRTSNQAVMGISRDVAERLANGRFVAIHRRLILVKFPTAFLLNREANGTKQG
jgi:hypothetical protein